MTSTVRLGKLLGSCVAVAVLGAGCSTELVVKQIDATTAAPSGFVVNKRASYKIEQVATTGPLGQIQKDDKPTSVSGLDHHKVLEVDVCRWPFASSVLKLELTESQVIKKIELESTPGAVGTAKSAAAIVGAVSDIEKARRDAKEKEDEEKKDEAETETDQ